MAYLKRKRHLLSESSFLKYSLFSKRRRFWVHEINKVRPEFGKYHHLMPQLRNDEAKLKDYLSMSSSTFDLLLGYINNLTFMYPLVDANWILN